MKPTSLLRNKSFAPPDADAVIRVVFESARRSGVDVPENSNNNNSLHLASSHHQSTTSDAAKRQARDYALRVQKFRDQQRKLASARGVGGSAPAATVQYSLRQQQHQQNQEGSVSTQNNNDEDDDPLASLFSNIDGPKLKQMTKPLASPAKPVPQLFDQQQEQDSEGAMSATAATRKGSSPLPNVVIAAKGTTGGFPTSLSSSKKKRPPSPTRKTTSLKKTIVESTTSSQQQRQRSSSPSDPNQPRKYFFGDLGASVGDQNQQKTSSAGLKLDVPQLEIEVMKKKTVPVFTSSTTTTTSSSSESVSSTHHHQTIGKPTAAEEEESQKKQQQTAAVSESEQTTAATTTSFEAVSRPTFESATSSTSTSTTTFSSQQQQTIFQDSTTAATSSTTTQQQQQLRTDDDASQQQQDSLLKQEEELKLKREQEKLSQQQKTSSSSSTVEDWAALRSQELEQIKREREAAILAEQQEKLLKEENEKIAAWIKSRTPAEPVDPLTHFAGKTPQVREMNDLFNAATWEAAFSAFTKIHKQPSTSQETLTHALSLAAAHTWKWDEERKTKIQSSFDAITSRLRLPTATKNLLSMLLQSDEAASQNFMTKMSDEDRAQLPRFMFERYSNTFFNNNFQNGTWEANLQFVQNMKKLRADPYLRLESILLRSMARPRSLCWQPSKRAQMTELIHNIEQQCRSKLSQLGANHAVVLMYAFSRVHASSESRRIFHEMKERNALDEDIAAAFIRMSNTQTIENVIPELRKAKINVLSSSCTRAIVYSMCGRGETSAAIETVRAFATVTPPEEWSIFDLRAAVVACERHMNPSSSENDKNNNDTSSKPTSSSGVPPDAGIVDTIRAATLATWNNAEVACPRVTSFLIMALLALGRTSDVLEIAKTVCNPSNSKILDRLRDEAFEAMNATLASAKLRPRVVSAKREELLKEIAARKEAKLNAALQRGGVEGGEGDSTATSTADHWADAAKKTATQQQQQKSSSSSSTNLIPAQVSEKMLEFGRTRNWSDALSLLNSLNLQQHSNQFVLPAADSGTTPTAAQVGLANSVTLLYNCAISAAVDRPETVDELVDEMKSLNLQSNATTTNTIMTSFGKTEDRWSEALDLFSKNSTPRDVSTYSVALSILGKRSQWQQANAVFSEMKKQPGMTKPTTVAFGLLIQATHKDSWELTLRAFQDMIKVHGPASAREVVVNRVVKSLDAAGKSAESTRLLESLRKQQQPTAEGKGGKKNSNKKK